MSPQVKICGLSTADGLEAALEAGADYVGFVFFPASPRHVSLEAAKALGDQVGGRAGKVALSVDADDATLDALVASLRPDLLQLHGRETPDRVVAIKRRFGLPVMKALPIAVSTDLEAVRSYAGVADRFLFDARPPKNASRPGGLGRAFDWRLLEGIETALPFMLSGGLEAANVADAIAIARPAAVDVSSGVERAPGEKDPEKIRAFIAAARRAATSRAPIRVQTA